MIDHLSASSVGMYLRCGVQWEFRYVRGLKVPPGGALVRGKALDEAANLHYREKARGHGLKEPDFVEAAVQAHGSIVENEETALDMTEGQSRDVVAKASRGYYQGAARLLTPRSREDVQRKFVTTLDGCEVVGFVDLITDADQVVDTKLKGRLPDQAALDRDLQLGTYAWLTGLSRLALAIAQPSGRTTIVWTERDAEDIRRVQRLYSRVWAGVGAGIAVPAQPDSWACTPAWCGYWSRCEFGQGGRDR